MISRSNRCLKGLCPLIAVSLFGCAPEGDLEPETTAEVAGESLALEDSGDDALLANALAPNAALQEGDELVISQEEWFTIQRYVTSSLALPQTDAQLRLWLKMEQTEQHNGVLIFVAPRTHKFAIIGDAGVHEKCGDPFWQELAAAMTEHFRNHQFTEGIVHGVTRAGELLARHFPCRTDDKNELPDDVEHD